VVVAQVLRVYELAIAGAGTAITPCVLPVLPALLSASAAGGRDCPLRPVLCAADFSLGLNRLGDSVRCDDDIGVEHGDERLEVAGAQGGKKGVDDFALTGEVRAGSGVCSLNAPAGATGELTNCGG